MIYPITLVADGLVRRALLLAHIAATWFMVGVIWFCAIVHYPLLAAVGADAFTAYETANIRLTTWLVAPVMLVEALTCVALYRLDAVPRDPLWRWANLTLLAVIWLVSLANCGPSHDRLAECGYDSWLLANLLVMNWLRVLCWTGRGLLVFSLIKEAQTHSGAYRSPQPERTDP